MYLRMGVAVKEDVPSRLPVTADPSPGPTLPLEWPCERYVASALRLVGPVPLPGWLWGWHRAGAGWLGKDIDEDLTGGVPELGVGIDMLEQRLPQWLRRVVPQVAPGPGQREHGPADGLFLWGPVRNGGCCEGPSQAFSFLSPPAYLGCTTGGQTQAPRPCPPGMAVGGSGAHRVPSAGHWPPCNPQGAQRG